MNEECADMRCAGNGHLISRGCCESTKREFMVISVCSNNYSQRRLRGTSKVETEYHSL